MRLLVLVLSLDREPWSSIEREGQRPTWVRSSLAPVRFYYGPTGPAGTAIAGAAKGLGNARLGRARKTLLRGVGELYRRQPVVASGDRIYTGVPEAYYTVGAKTLAAFRHALDAYDFDYLYRTNTSSYLNTGLLIERLHDMPRNSLYAGFPGHADGVDFASGTSILLSRDIAEAVTRAPGWEHEVTDDVALGRMAARLGVPLHPTERAEVNTPEQVDDLPVDILADVPLFRCKSLTDRTQDAVIMRRLHKRITER